MLLVIVALLLLVWLGSYLSWRATRLDRLHRRVEAARVALDAALLRRADAAGDLADQGVLRPRETRALVEAIDRVRQAQDDERELAESALSVALREALRHTAGPLAAPDPRLDEVLVAARRVHLARVFHNDAVSDTRRVRRSRLVRLFRLAGTAALPDYFEMDDQTPRTALPQGGTAAH